MYDFKCVTILQVFIEYESKLFRLTSAKGSFKNIVCCFAHTVWSVIITPMCFGHKHFLFCNKRTSEKLTSLRQFDVAEDVTFDIL